jgi:two-component system, OmpR family, response regulator MprA
VAVPTRARILVVDDDPRLAESLRRALAFEGYAVQVAPDGVEGLRVARERMPDLVVLDRMMPGLDGVEVCRRLRTVSAVPVLMLTARDAIADRVEGLDAGADDYLVKPFALDELLARVRALLRRHDPDEHELLRFSDLVMDTAGREVRRGQRPVELTQLQFDLLERFLRHPRIVLDRDRLLEVVWGLDPDTASNVVDVYVGYLRVRLEAAGEPRLLHTVRGIGYVLREA